ncbi:uncharacterized protein LOC114527241 [Dendronephthya gigantea]|uniref:uncharacterized protein LOC114527241 n=1 Tax=Dendronephthya gigantea TaxID=151771 RepID=UPI00106B6539|nr:uncharacterized protein LOC114527241 [Dendronephthya gigantea]
MHYRSLLILIILIVSVTTSPLEKYIKLTAGVSKAAYLPLAGNRFIQNGHIMEKANALKRKIKFFESSNDKNQEKIACSLGGWSAKSHANRDTEVLLFTHPEMKLAIFGFRGTESKNLNDWRKNFKTILTSVRIGSAGFKIHQGFRDRYLDISPWFESEYQAIPQDYKIMITGHSLGGALATVSAVYAGGKLNRKPDAVIPFASPLVGEKDFQAYYEEFVGCDHTLRVTVKNDMVTKIPPPLVGYVHVCSPLELEGNTGFLDELKLAENHSLYRGYAIGLAKRYKNENNINLGCDRSA